MARSKSVTRSAARPAPVSFSPSPVSDADLSWLIAALSREQAIDAQDILPALHELKARRAADAPAAPAAHPTVCDGSSRPAESFPATPDALKGLAWWNGLEVGQRRYWLLKTRGGSPAECWEAYKAHLSSAETLAKLDRIIGGGAL